MPGPGTHYQVLGIPETARPEQIKLAYRRAAKTAHPDAGGSPAAMERVNEAYRVLSDPSLRRAYDRSLNAPAPHPEPPVANPAHPQPGRPAPAQPQAHQDYAYHHRLRLAQARSWSWRWLKNSLGLALMLGIIVRFFAAQTADPVTKLLLNLSGFIPVYGAMLGVIFLINPEIRLTLHDLPHQRGRRLKRDLILVAGLAGASIPLAILWLVFFRI